MCHRVNWTVSEVMIICIANYFNKHKLARWISALTVKSDGGEGRGGEPKYFLYKQFLHWENMLKKNWNSNTNKNTENNSSNVNQLFRVWMFSPVPLLVASTQWRIWTKAEYFQHFTPKALGKSRMQSYMYVQTKSSYVPGTGLLYVFVFPSAFLSFHLRCFLARC